MEASGCEHAQAGLEVGERSRRGGRAEPKRWSSGAEEVVEHYLNEFEAGAVSDFPTAQAQVRADGERAMVMYQ